MAIWWRRVRYASLAVGAGGLFVLNGCGLSDQQLAGIWSSLISSGLNTIFSNIISLIFNLASAAATT